MITTRYMIRTARVLTILFAAVYSSEAALISTNYGNFSGASVDYLQVTESSTSDSNLLYGTPAVSGNSLDFNPNGFAAASQGGSDTTSGHLSMDVMSQGGFYIDTLQFNESGDFTLLGLGTDATYVDVSATFYVEILEVDGAAIAPILSTNNMTFSPNADGTFALLSDGGGSPLYNGIWQGSSSIDLGALLTDNSIDYAFGATKLRVNLDNTLIAVSESNTQALIAKKNFSEFSITATIPEPASMGLLGVFSLLIGYIRYRFIV